ncbi:FAD-binding oxidoreductase [Nocardioides sp. AE5]|uniref:FAD-binding oxidoreductase n=1 Tax=Nocardioides sp. AE5 TaxID=2962573 RepID=UPI0028813EC9|nr:FAD-binding oxidoreductase [Nocardioides sp. AE5]MDT0203276.1 FAD-binding oxidoreductase [Nocardioides sp. AE5]
MTSSQGRNLTTHREAERRLLQSFHAIPPGEPVRLAKRTSNLFRPRARTGVPGLDVSGLDGVLSVDPTTRTADVQGMCTYEDLVAATLPHGLIPLVVPQLRTITLGGAVTGLGIESTSFRNGLPHESVLEMDVLTGAGEIVTATAGTTENPGENSDLFATFPNSYGSLGYATRLRIELERVPRFVALQHVRFDDATLMAKAIEEIVTERTWQGEPVDGLDGVSFQPGEHYLTLARWTDDPLGGTSDYTGQEIYYRSLQQREHDLLTVHDYLWRWDTDWFWCSGAFGLHNPRIRRLWPKRWRRSDVYHKLVGLDRRFGIIDRIDRRKGRPQRERVIQDVEVPVENLPDFLAWFDEHVGMRPVWLCPLRLRGDRTWPTYPLQPATTYVNIGFWGTVPVGPDADQAPMNRAIEERVHQLGGHKSLYSEAFYDKETFDALYDGANLAAVKARHDPDDRFTSLHDKAVRRR